MILLDTNVVSEMMRRTPAAPVMAYLRSRRDADLFLPSLVMAELRHGIAKLPAGHRQSNLQAELEAVLARGFEGRIVAFDAACAAGYGQARAARERMGRPVPPMDGLIGGMALAHGATLATRNVGDFDGYGLALVNPWDAT